MTVLSTMSISGDADALVARMETIDAVAASKAAGYGGISSTIVRTADGIRIYNLWQTEEGRHQMAADPEMQKALQGAGFEPSFEALEVLAYRSTGEAAKELVRRFTEEVWNKGNLDAIGEFLAEDHVAFDPTSGEVRGVEGYRQLVAGYRGAFPDMRMEIDRIVAEGDTVATFWTARGTHKGELMGIEPTGKEATVMGSDVARIRDGKLVESRGLFDALGMLQQIGAIPASALAPAPA